MKLDELCAIKVMGWTKEYDRDVELNFYQNPGGSFAMMLTGWNPSRCLDDALVCLERAVGVDKWNCGKWSNGDNKVKYYCEIHRSPSEGAYGETLALAMCRAALRAMGVPESEISLAME